MNLPLQLRHDPAPSGDAVAWFLPGDSVERWLGGLTGGGLAGAETRLYVVPRSVDDRAPAGLLVVPARAEDGVRVPQGIACRVMAGRLFLPADAFVHPPLTDAEVVALCPLPITFFHPVFGLSSFEENDELRAWDLIQPREERASDWNLARAGAPAMPELSAILLAQPPSLQDLFGGAEEEIATEPPVDLPPAPDEPKEDPWQKARRNLKRFFAKSVSTSIRHLPHRGSRRTWLNAVEDWANRQLRGVTEQLDKLRHKELRRLLHLLDTDPEAGLRHAIPMNAFAHRGLAPPTTRLGSRSPNFDLSRLGGGAADFWNVPDDLQTVLRRRYREMADREMQLGRYRRAAYIYAELLGDLVSAAHALRQGRHFREAALLYEEHLNNPLQAARCLADGGLFAEALERFAKLEMWLEVADMHERLGNRTGFEQAIRRVIDQRIAQDDILGAANLVEDRLRQTDEALALLLCAWPSSRQAAACVAAAFQMLARLGRHDAARGQLARFDRGSVSRQQLLPLLGALGGPALTYPDPEVRQRAADLSRVLIARELNAPPLDSERAGEVLMALVRLAPGDRLLARDANRHLAGLRGAELRARRLTPPPRPGARPVAQRRFQLPREIQWLQLRREWHWFFALGVTRKRVTLVRGIWEGEFQSLSWNCSADAVKSGFVFEPTADQGRTVALARASGPPLAQQRFPAADAFFGQECVAGTPGWLPGHGFPFAFSDDAVWTIHLASGQAILSSHDKNFGRLQRTIDLTDALLSGASRTETARVCLAALANRVAVALGNRLVVSQPGGELLSLELPDQAHGLVPTRPHTRQGVAVTLEHGAVMHWAGTETFIELDRDLAAPLATFVPAGPLVLVSDRRCVLLEVDARGVQTVARTDLPGMPAIGVSGTAYPGEFAVLSETGEMFIYRMPR